MFCVVVGRQSKEGKVGLLLKDFEFISHMISQIIFKLINKICLNNIWANHLEMSLWDILLSHFPEIYSGRTILNGTDKLVPYNDKNIIGYL